MRTAIEVDYNVLRCPVCRAAQSALHHGNVLCAKPEIRIEMWCEGCHSWPHDCTEDWRRPFVITIRQHKGATIMEWAE